MKSLLTFAVTLLITTAAYAQNNGPPPGECVGGLCGTPNQSGGGCGCGCGCSILIAFTDQGDTYQYADDFDDDGIEDDFDNCPFAFNPTQPDADGDGAGDDCDNCATVANAGLSDVDADGEGDACDVDADNDEILNIDDNCLTVPNSAQANHDTDGFGDACDDNDDGDNCADALDNCPLIGAADCVDDGAVHTSECFPDEDADAIEDATDNCPGVPNLDQGDADGDGFGDLCDTDLDQDGIANLFDNCPQLPNDGISDIDRDGRGDACDPFLCYVITDEASCLDPAASFAVHAGKTIETQTGKEKLLHLFANRESRAIKYTWSVVKSPNNTDEYTITNPVGSVSVSSSVEYIYETGREPQFSAKVPGEYTVEVTAELVHPEDDAYDVKTAKSQVVIKVGGETLSGCSSTGSTGAVPAGMLLGLFALIRRRRR